MSKLEPLPRESQLVSELLGSWGEADSTVGQERRRSQRREYPYVQLVAPCRDTSLPQPGEFKEVRCRDISADGFSYFSPGRPEYRELVVGFGTQPELIYLKATVVHVTPCTAGGENVFLVGCRYRGRMQKENS